ncbi:MAG: hypothetical protein QNJ45_14270 [Ardenticatenaceae bacterium]|nr:hypothetical protein [Ardenticatenaceae bacterium]
MFENYLLISLLITVAWIGLVAYYMVISGRQRILEEELDTLQSMIDQQEDEGNNTYKKEDRDA